MRRTRVRRKGEGGVYVRGDKWWISYYTTISGQREQQREPTGKRSECGEAVYVYDKEGEKKAYGYLAEVMKQVGAAELGATAFAGMRQQRLLLREILDAYLTKKKADALSERRELRKPFLCDFNNAKKHFGDYRALSLTDVFWNNWKINGAEELIHDQEYAPSTLNRWMEIVRAALRYGVKAKMIAALPCDLNDIMYDESSNVRKGFFEHEEFERLLKAQNDEDLRDYYTFGYLVGWRSGSIKSLKWQTVDLHAGQIELPKLDEKSRSKNVMPIGERGDVLYDLIQRRLARRHYKNASGMDAISEYVFHRKGEPIGDVRKSWDTACTQAGLVRPAADAKGNVIKVKGKPVMVASKLFHDFRRTAARNIYIATGNKELAKQITGHRTDAMFDRYNILVNSQKLVAIRQTMKHLAKQNNELQTKGPIKHKTSTTDVQSKDIVAVSN